MVGDGDEVLFFFFFLRSSRLRRERFFLHSPAVLSISLPLSPCRPDGWPGRGRPGAWRTGAWWWFGRRGNRELCGKVENAVCLPPVLALAGDKKMILHAPLSLPARPPPRPPPSLHLQPKCVTPTHTQTPSPEQDLARHGEAGQGDPGAEAFAWREKKWRGREVEGERASGDAETHKDASPPPLRVPLSPPLTHSPMRAAFQNRPRKLKREIKRHVSCVCARCSCARSHQKNNGTLRLSSTHPVRSASMPGARMRTKVQVQMVSRTTVRKAVKSKRADM